MTGLPSDVREKLVDELTTASEQVRAGNSEGAKATARRISGVAIAEVADDELAERLVHGCAEVEYLAEDAPAVAAEYLRIMRATVTGEPGTQ